MCYINSWFTYLLTYLLNGRHKDTLLHSVSVSQSCCPRVNPSYVEFPTSFWRHKNEFFTGQALFFFLVTTGKKCKVNKVKVQIEKKQHHLHIGDSQPTRAPQVTDICTINTLLHSLDIFTFSPHIQRHVTSSKKFIAQNFKHLYIRLQNFQSISSWICPYLHQLLNNFQNYFNNLHEICNKTSRPVRNN